MAGKRGTKYENLVPTTMGMNLRSIGTMLRDQFKRDPRRRPARPIPVVPLSLPGQVRPEGIRVAWFGHSAFVLELAGRRLLFDPMFSPSPSPVPVFGGRRYSGGLPLEPEDFPRLDAIVLSHNHFDHLDKASIGKLRDKTDRFVVPLGVRRLLIKWGVPPEQVTEHGWWDELEVAGLRLACTPARHFSGRGLFDRNGSLWCSWAVIGARGRFFFSGDSGYAPHFKAIGERYGPFDLTLMECGQYDERWANIHMLPEQTVQAHLDVRGGLLVPVHWAAFTLGFHAWDDPVERAVAAARAHGVRIATPRIGEIVEAAEEGYPQTAWWREQR
ncbi:MBL fold metallo-hydrolase [Paenibacillus sp. GCM10023250]|uniref:MBL fold metallo-hydrolase n=1 Tax=Paenibacillus sp. GCM10023250 TaxID=3252648 RepID=UPI00361892B5